MRTAVVSLLVFCFSSLSGYAQGFFEQGYIVTVADDTIQGEIREIDNRRIRFRTSTGQPEREYGPSQLISYTMEDVPRIVGRLSEQGKDTTLFLREQVKGYVSLYRLLQPDGRLSHVLGLPNQTLLPLRGSLAPAVLNANLKECSTPVLRNLLNPASFYNSNLYYERLIRAYNDCVKPAATVKRQRRRSGFELGILAGAAANSWKYGATEDRFNPYWNPNGVYSAYYTFAAGVFYTLAPRRRMSMTIEGFFSQYEGKRTVRINDPLYPANPATRFYRFDEQYVTVPITARYAFITKPVRFYVKAGVAVNRTLTVNGYYNNPSGSDASLPMRSGLSVGYLAGLGIGIPVSTRRTVYAEARFTPHFVTYGVTRLANSRSVQLTVLVPVIGR